MIDTLHAGISSCHCTTKWLLWVVKMPDMERIIDQLRVDMAELGYKSKGKNASFWDGYRSGKSRARWEVVIVFAAIYFVIAAIGHYCT